MSEKILIVEDEFIVANDLRLILERSGYKVVGIASSVPEALSIISQNKPTIVLLDIYLKGNQTGIDLARQLTEMNITFVYLSANSNQQVLEEAKATRPYGFLVKPFREKDVIVTLDIARYRHENSIENQFRKETQLQKLLVNIGSEELPWDQKLLNMGKALQNFIPYDYLALTLRNENNQYLNGISFQRIGFDQYQIIREKEFSIMTGLTTKEIQRLNNQYDEKDLVFYNDIDFEHQCKLNSGKNLLAKTFHLTSNLVVPVVLPNHSHFILSFYSRRNNSYHQKNLEFLNRFLPYFSVLGDFIPTTNYPESEALAPGHNHASSSEKEHPSSFENIIGNSPKLLFALDHVTQVAPLDTSVLILGESGTGKEKIALSIHNLSPRHSKPLVKINCAALPANLIESELFGHEKGAFTGALDRRIGKFEQAEGGTVFLDEIGEMPVEMQVKLLRVLQEKEIERIGGKSSIQVDVRIIAATNRNLEQEVAEGRFRLDLYYRLNVFPITLPPLRERMEDIKPLSLFFASNYSKKFNRPFYGIAPGMLHQMEQYTWPGNIRELENIIEQSVILSDGQTELTLKRPLVNSIFSNTNSNSTNTTVVRNLTDVKKVQEETERNYIISVLKKTNGKIRGDGGAAEILNIKPTTLESRMLKLGIRKEDII